MSSSSRCVYVCVSVCAMYHAIRQVPRILPPSPIKPIEGTSETRKQCCMCARESHFAPPSLSLSPDSDIFHSGLLKMCGIPNTATQGRGYPQPPPGSLRARRRVARTRRLLLCRKSFVCLLLLGHGRASETKRRRRVRVAVGDGVRIGNRVAATLVASGRQRR